MRAEEHTKELLVLQKENNRLRNEIKVLQEYKEKAHAENNKENKSKYRTIKTKNTA